MPKQPQTRPGSMERIRAAALERSTKSTLHRWMIVNRKEFADLLRELGRPDWKVLAEIFGEEELTDGEGKSPSSETSRQTWHKVRTQFASEFVGSKRGGKSDDQAQSPVRMIDQPMTADPKSPSPKGAEILKRMKR